MGETIVEKREGGCLSSWFGRIVLGAITIGIITMIIAVVAYMDVKSDRGKPLEIDPYAGLREPIVTQLAEDQQRMVYQQLFEDFSIERMQEVERHYSRQSDSCSRLSDKAADELGQVALADTHTVICYIDRTHTIFSRNVFGFNQGVRIEIGFSRVPETGELNGRVDVIVTQWWTE